jgi:hypothetical protein
MIMINDRPHITLLESAYKLGIGYRAAYGYVMNHSEIPRQKIGRQYFVCYDDLSKHPRYIKRDGVLV